MYHFSQYICMGYLVGAGLARSALHNVTKRAGIFLFSKPSRPVLGPSKTPIECLFGALLREYSNWGVKVTTQLHLVPRLGMNGLLPPLLHVPSWPATFLLLHLAFSSSFLPVTNVMERTIEKLKVSYLLIKFPMFFITAGFITGFPRAHQWYL